MHPKHKQYALIVFPILTFALAAAQVGTALKTPVPIASQRLSIQRLAGNVVKERTLLVEPATRKNYYQPTIRILLTKPLKQKLAYPVTIDESIPAAFAKSRPQLTLSMPPTSALADLLRLQWQFGTSQEDVIRSSLDARTLQIRSDWMEGKRTDWYVTIKREPMTKANALKIFNAAKTALMPSAKK